MFLGMKPLLMLLTMSLLFAGCAPGENVCDAGAPQAPQPSVSGAWKGTYECNNTVQKLSAALAENEAGQIDGEMFLDYTIMILGQPFTLTGRANVDDGLATGTGYSAFVDVLDNSQGMPDWQLVAALNEDGDEFNGEFQRTNGADVEVVCPVLLDRVQVRDAMDADRPDGG